MNDTILKALNIRKAYREGSISTQVLRGASMEARRGLATAIIGRSGSGKSTLLHILGTLDTPDSGSLMFNGEDLTKLSDSQKAAFRSKNLGFVYQFHHLLPDFSALENVMMPLLIAGMGMRQARQRATEYLSLVGLEGKLSSRPSEMSGGERQRAAIARALCPRPSLILADEPTGNLDAKNAQAVFDLFTTLTKKDGAAVVMVTHDNSLAARCDRVLTISDGVIADA
ncbi:MAG: ABC transporter ATP-binding protein [Aeromonadales bacterium]|nr:ABC transporter ATP-binding protein [Aeromonadales bacterium]MDY2891465.1 ABC transporter ATP-binding protein [Succinivibrio sp.]